MRLTNYMRDAFIAAALQDVPKEDSDEQKRVLLKTAALSALPPKIRAIYDDPVTRDFICNTQLGRNFGFAYVPGLGTMPPDTEEAYKVLAEKGAAQSTRREALRVQLRAVAYSVNTRKALATLLPEFEKYLPVDEAAACKTLPAVANVMADFAKAGWPKGAVADAAADANGPEMQAVA